MALKMKYFVLKPRSKGSGDPYAHASRWAMKAYAYSIKKHDPELARELIEWCKDETKRAIDNILVGGEKK